MSSGCVVVTGGAGFIGSHTVDALVDRGATVIVLDDFSTGRRENLAQWDGDDRVRVVETDIVDGLFAPLSELVAQHGPVDRIIHLAAQTSVVRSIEEPLVDARINHLGAIQVLEYGRRMRVKKIVFASSAAVYGDVTTFPVTEDLPPSPLSPYGIHKRSNELLFGYGQTVHGVPATGLRFFNVYGPRQDPHSPYTGVISIFADRARVGKELVIYGDGEQSRDFVYVGDVARIVCDCAFAERDSTGIMNVGTGQETTVNTLAKHIVELSAARFGKRSAIAHVEARPGEIRRSVADVSRARTRVGFAPKEALKDGLEKTLGSLA